MNLASGIYRVACFYIGCNPDITFPFSIPSRIGNGITTLINYQLAGLPAFGIPFPAPEMKQIDLNGLQGSLIQIIGVRTLRLLERASLQVLTSVDRKVHIINYKVYYPVPSFINSTG